MKISRIVSIITILLDKKRLSAQELAELFEVSLRTIYRDIDAINLAGNSDFMQHQELVAALKLWKTTKLLTMFFPKPIFQLF